MLLVTLAAGRAGRLTWRRRARLPSRTLLRHVLHHLLHHHLHHAHALAHHALLPLHALHAALHVVVRARLSAFLTARRSAHHRPIIAMPSCMSRMCSCIRLCRSARSCVLRTRSINACISLMRLCISVIEGAGGTRSSFVGWA